jgi:hypothetical protein
MDIANIAPLELRIKRMMPWVELTDIFGIRTHPDATMRKPERLIREAI